MIIERICRHVATLGPIGYLPMPGTCGSLCAVPLFYFVRQVACSTWWFNERWFVLLFAAAAWWIINRALRTYEWHEHDPQEIVLDEVAGFCVVMVGQPWSLVTVALGFLYFRFFDIVKPLGLGSLERLPGALGVLGDDLAAGLLAHLALSWTLGLLTWVCVH